MPNTFHELTLRDFIGFIKRNKELVKQILEDYRDEYRDEHGEEASRSISETIDIFIDSINRLDTLNDAEIEQLIRGDERYLPLKHELEYMKNDFFHFYWQTLNNFIEFLEDRERERLGYVEPDEEEEEFEEDFEDEEEGNGEEEEDGEEGHEERNTRRKSARLRGEEPPFASLGHKKKHTSLIDLNTRIHEGTTITLSDGLSYTLADTVNMWRFSKDKTLVNHPYTEEDKRKIKAFLKHHVYNARGEKISGGRKTKKYKKMTLKKKRMSKQMNKTKTKTNQTKMIYYKKSTTRKVKKILF